MFLLDTVILSETRKCHRDPGVVAWLSQQRDADLYLSVVTIGEIERGIAQQQRRNPDFAQTLSQWLDRVLTLYGDRILPVDIATARRWGELSTIHGNNGADLLIAASALTRGLTVVTRNERHFRPTGVDVCNPFVEGWLRIQRAALPWEAVHPAGQAFLMLDFYSGAHAQASGAQLMWRADVLESCAVRPEYVNWRLASTLVGVHTLLRHEKAIKALLKYHWYLESVEIPNG